jgi:hypothetical protein
MNPNIEMVNRNLWLVNFGHVRMNWIDGLYYLDEKDDCNNYAALTEDGRLYVNKATEYCDTIKLMMNRLMQRSDKELADMLIQMQKKVNLPHQDRYEEFFLCMIQWEIKRRSVQKEYFKRHKLLFVIENIKERWCKKYGNNTNSNKTD